MAGRNCSRGMQACTDGGAERMKVTTRVVRRASGGVCAG